ncbi:MAG: AhpC/TSA family protein [Polyangiales bacterium]
MHTTEDRLSQQVTDDMLAAAVAATRVLSLDGSSVRLRDAWGGRTVVHVFVRQFGCLFCHEMVASLIELAPRVVARKGHVVVVGSGSVEQAARFATAKGLPREGVSLFTDPGRESFERAGLARTWTGTFLEKDARRAFVRAREEGFKITGVAGDVPQLGGAMVVKPPARLAYLHRSRFAGDHPDLEAVLAAVG